MPVGAWSTILLERRNPGTVRDLRDRGAHCLVQFIADGELDAALASPVRQLVAGASRANAQQQLDVLAVLGGNLLDRLLGHLDLIGGGVRAGVPWPHFAGEGLAGFIRVGEHRVKPNP
jgi:hypothetical protein